MNPESPRVGVVIPTHHRPDLLVDALRSVADQRLLPDQVIVVDDAGDEATREVVERFTGTTGSSVSLVLSNRAGASRSRNLGVARSEAELLAFLDDDDEWEPDFLSSCVELLMHHPRIDAAFTWIRYVRDGRTEALRSLHEDLSPPDPLIVNPGVTASNLCVRRSTLERVGGFDELLPASQDVDLFVRLLRAGATYRVVPRPLLVVRLHEGTRITSTPASVAAGRRALYEKHRDLLTPTTRAVAWARAMAVQAPSTLTPIERLGRAGGRVLLPLQRRWIRRRMPHTRA